MLQRLYVNIFCCLVNFELKFDRFNLLLGVNGSGKSCVFDVLRKIQSFIIKEELKIDEKPLFVFCDDTATLYRDDHTVLQEYP